MTASSAASALARVARGPAAFVLAIAVLAALALATSARAQLPGESHCGNETAGAPYDGFLSHAQVGESLRQIQQASQGRVSVSEVGRTNQGREIWAARVGHGDQVMLVESAIHGNEQHGTRALLNLVATIGNNSARSAKIREQITFVAIPNLNADGAAVPRRQNVMPWADVRALYGFAETPRAWYYSNFAGGFDVNRDFNADLDYEPNQADLPGAGNRFGFYITPEARTVREVYRGLENEFGRVHVFVDLHNQAPCYGVDDEDFYSPLSISGRFLTDPTAHGNWPNFDDDASRRANVAVYDALQRLGASMYGKVTRYPQPPGTNIPGTALASFGLRGSAAVLFETSGQTQQIGLKRHGLLSKQVEVGLTGIVDALTDGTFDDIDPDRYGDIPLRVNSPGG